MEKLFVSFATATARIAGKPWTFLGCVLIVLVWAASGPIFKFSETWQLVINTGTTIITFLMVFLIQNTQNRDGAALQTKLDELIVASSTENQFIGIEKLTNKELESLHAHCVSQAQKSQEWLEKAKTERDKRGEPATSKATASTGRQAAKPKTTS